MSREAAAGHTISSTDLDAIADRLLASIAPLRIGPTVDTDDLDTMYCLRGAEVIERGWAPPEDLPDGRDRDEYDAEAVQFAVRHDDQVVGTCRVLLPTHHRLLPIEREFGLQLEPKGRVVQWSRLVLQQRYRGDPQHRLAMACYGAMYLETARRGYTAFAGVMSKPLLEIFRGMGVTIEVLAEPRLVEGEMRYPAMSSPSMFATGLATMRRLLT